MRLTRIIILFSIPFLFANCSDEPSCPDASKEYLYNIQEVRNRIPYLGNEKLSYNTNNNEALNFVGSGIRKYFSISKKRDPNPDCNVYTTLHYEVLEFIYYNLLNSDSLFLQLERKNGTCTFIGNESIFYFDVYVIKDRTTKNDSIQINNKWFYNHSTLINQQFDTLVINKENGILKSVNYSTGKQLTIKN
ncbi:MAG: hypothetical protein ACK5UI_00265 [Bacteroidota bacterium]|jgi:hypothetical protein